MKQKRHSKKTTLLTLLDSVLAVTVLLLSLQLLGLFNVSLEREIFEYSTMYGYAVALFFTLAVVEALKLYSHFRENKLDDLLCLLGIVLYLIGAVLLLLRKGDTVSSSVSTLFYGIMLLLGRILALVRNRMVRRIVSNSIAILLIGICFISVARVILAPVFLFILSLYRAASIAFSQINLRKLNKIIRKTYAREIIFGMLLLIVVFSIIIQRTEEGVESFFDALWYCFAIVTTIGFGDIAVTGLLSRFLSMILGIYGIIVVSLITSIIVNFYNEVKNEHEHEPEDAALPPTSPEDHKEDAL